MSSNKFTINECSGILNQRQLECVLAGLPIEFYLVDEEVDSRQSFEKHSQGEIEVYHEARVVNLHPPKGKRLSKAEIVVDLDFPLRPHQIMDDHIGLRSCFHPKLHSFGLDEIKQGCEPYDEIEIDLYKFSRENRDRIYVKPSNTGR